MYFTFVLYSEHILHYYNIYFLIETKVIIIFNFFNTTLDLTFSSFNNKSYLPPVISPITLVIVYSF